MKEFQQEKYLRKQEHQIIYDRLSQLVMSYHKLCRSNIKKEHRKKKQKRDSSKKENIQIKRTPDNL